MLLCGSQGWVCHETVSLVFFCCLSCVSNQLPTRNRVIHTRLAVIWSYMGMFGGPLGAFKSAPTATGWFTWQIKT